MARVEAGTAAGKRYNQAAGVGTRVALLDSSRRAAEADKPARIEEDSQTAEAGSQAAEVDSQVAEAGSPVGAVRRPLSKLASPSQLRAF